MATNIDNYREVTLPPLVSPILKACYENEEAQIYRENLDSSPHGKPWHTSFHGSSFPGLDPKACPRKALYSMMDLPADKPINRRLRGQIEAGKAIEDQVVWRFARAGILLSPDPDSEFQMNLVEEEAWLTGSPDAVIKTPSGSAHVVEIKTKSNEKVEEMISGLRSYDESHKVQLFTYMSKLLLDAPEDWPEIKGGSLFYLSRNDPSIVCEYRFEPPSPSFYEEGIEKLKDWKQDFLSDKLPARPKDWKWTELPCKWCPYKKFACKPDYKDNVVELSESNGIEFAKDIREDYDYEETRKRVLDRWAT